MSTHTVVLKGKEINLDMIAVIEKALALRGIKLEVIFIMTK